MSKVRNIYYVHAFTLLEMILSLIIGMLVISLAYQAYMNIYSEWRNYSIQQSRLTSMILFKQAMDNDLESSICVIAIDKNEYGFVNHVDTVFYSFDKSVRRVHSGSVDNFDVSCENLVPHIVPFLERHNVVDTLNMKIIRPLDIGEVSFVKYYTSQELMAFYSQMY